jgi:hypothetical protein
MSLLIWPMRNAMCAVESKFHANDFVEDFCFGFEMQTLEMMSVMQCFHESAKTVFVE